ncbi:RNA-binding protein, putative [Entamoeba invadens IP1]|uniref:RNA-binding protein, putative n=1 Tax=Entamoeba invadens IP1 TaxID=370355 RepID=A0A0A1U9T9_ENTIV|nr:RNA-binding protein, putative [Entamoeba invadens IP1]ELP89886.1 RNA-binding protein, putative [Entamoeba invadens IP1]|eukprot:XP_004256657.1 RNA-binding protein, putative [Entamoeba invadens IP1]
MTKSKKQFDNDRSVFVGNLNKKMTEPEFLGLFTPFGPISRHNFHVSDRLFHSAFVEFENSSSVERAMKLDGSLFQGKYLKVNKSTEKPQTDSKIKFIRNKTKGMKKKFVSNENYCILVNKINTHTDELTFAKIFGKAGKVIQVILPTTKGKKQKSRGFAIIEFAAKVSVLKALELNGTTIDGKKVIVSKMVKDETSAERKEKKKHNKIEKGGKKEDLGEESEEENQESEQDEEIKTELEAERKSEKKEKKSKKEKAEKKPVTQEDKKEMQEKKKDEEKKETHVEKDDDSEDDGRVKIEQDSDE